MTQSPTTKPWRALSAPLSDERLRSMPRSLGEDARDALAAPDELPAGALIGAARALRAGLGAAEDRADLQRWLRTSMDEDLVAMLLERTLISAAEATEALRLFCASSEPARAHLALALGRAFEPGPSSMPDADAALRAIRLRDDIESGAWALSLAARDPDLAAEAGFAHTRAREVARGLDELGEPLRTELARAVRASAGAADPWLAEVASLDEGWWLDAFIPMTLPMSALDALHPSARVFRLFPNRDRLQTRVPVAAADNRSAADRALSEDLGQPVSQLLEGRVAVHAVGLEPDDQVSPGLVVGATDDAVAISAVELDPPAPSAPSRDADTGLFWVPLAGCGDAPRQLWVRLDSGETANLELHPEPT